MSVDRRKPSNRLLCGHLYPTHNALLLQISTTAPRACMNQLIRINFLFSNYASILICCIIMKLLLAISQLFLWFCALANLSIAHDGLTVSRMLLQREVCSADACSVSSFVPVRHLCVPITVSISKRDFLMCFFPHWFNTEIIYYLCIVITWLHKVITNLNT